MSTRTTRCFLVTGAATALLSAVALAGDGDSATYKPYQTTCNKEDCRTIVMNDNGYGVVVEGDTKKGTERRARKKAEELNEEAEAGTVGDDVVDQCLFYPDLCKDLGF